MRSASQAATAHAEAELWHTLDRRAQLSTVFSEMAGDTEFMNALELHRAQPIELAYDAKTKTTLRVGYVYDDTPMLEVRFEHNDAISDPARAHFGTRDPWFAMVRLDRLPPDFVERVGTFFPSITAESLVAKVHEWGQERSKDAPSARDIDRKMSYRDTTGGGARWVESSRFAQAIRASAAERPTMPDIDYAFAQKLSAHIPMAVTPRTQSWTDTALPKQNQRFRPTAELWEQVRKRAAVQHGSFALAAQQGGRTSGQDRFSTHITPTDYENVALAYMDLARAHFSDDKDLLAVGNYMMTQLSHMRAEYAQASGARNLMMGSARALPTFARLLEIDAGRMLSALRASPDSPVPDRDLTPDSRGGSKASSWTKIYESIYRESRKVDDVGDAWDPYAARAQR